MVKNIDIVERVEVISATVNVESDSGTKYVLKVIDRGDSISVETTKGIYLGEAYHRMGSVRKPGCNLEKLLTEFIKNNMS